MVLNPIDVSLVIDKRPIKSRAAKIQLEEESKFDPYANGMEDGYGFWGAVVHLIRLTFGAGVLLLPHTMKSVGYVTGTALLLFVSVFYYHNMHVLISHEYRLCKLLNVQQITYASLAQKTFESAPFPLNKLGFLISKVMLFYFCLTVFNTTYLLVFAGSVQNLIKYFDLHLETSYIISITMIPMIIICMFRRLLKILVPFSAVTNFFSLVMAIILITCCCIYKKSNITLRPFGEPNQIPQTFAIYIQTFICTSSILPVKNYMKEPRRLKSPLGALNTSALVLTFLFINFALISYLCFGDDVEENILLNLPSNNQLSFIIYILYALAMFVIYILSFSVTFDNIWPEIEPRFTDKKIKFVLEYAVRIGLNSWSYLLAIGVQNLTLIMTICGTVAMALEVALIPVLELILVLRSDRKSIWIIFKDVCIIIVSAVLFYLSILDCVKDVISLYSK